MMPKTLPGWSETHASRSVALLLAWLMCGWLVAGCQNQAGPASGGTPAAVTAGATSTPAREAHPPTRAPLPTLAPTATITSSPTLILNWWVPEFISPKAPSPSGPLLESYLTDFQAARGDRIQVRPILKAKYGQGGLLDLLRTAQPVAPSTLPDLLVLDVSEVEQAVALGLLQPLDPLLPESTIRNLYPFARQGGLFDGRLLAVQYLADVEHIVYNRGQVPQPPSTWTELLVSKASYFFPTGNVQSASASSFTEDAQPSLLSQYFSAGEVFNPETRQMLLKEDALLRMLTFHSQAQSAGVLSPLALDATNLDDSWNAYAHGAALIANVSARQYLANQEAVPNTGYAPLPGWSNTARPIAGGWALAIVTTNPARQRAAAEFIAWLLAPEQQGRWTQASGWLPVSPSGWDAWEVGPYQQFLQAQLQTAVSHPIGLTYPQAAAQLRKGMLAVLKDRAAPAQAVQGALNQPAPK